MDNFNLLLNIYMYIVSNLVKSNSVASPSRLGIK